MSDFGDFEKAMLRGMAEALRVDFGRIVAQLPEPSPIETFTRAIFDAWVQDARQAGLLGERPKCLCDPETVRKVVEESGTCTCGGCPYGGDF